MIDIHLGGDRMKFVQAQFSLKYEPQIKIRRSVNDIEDFLQEHYGTPQTMPLPDEFAPEAPRIQRMDIVRLVFRRLQLILW